MVKVKVTARLESTSKLIRRTPFHKKLTEGLRDLIRLYYLFKNNEPYIPVMKDFLKRITGEEFEHSYRETINLSREVGDGVSNNDFFMGVTYSIDFHDKEKQMFVECMDLLEKSIKNREVYHFWPINWIYRGEADVSPVEYLYYPNASMPETLIDRAFIENIRKQQRQLKEYSIGGKKVTIHCKPYRAYKVWPITMFAWALLSKESDFIPPDIKAKRAIAVVDDLIQRTTEDLLPLPGFFDSARRMVPTPILKDSWEIPSISFEGWHNFFEIARSLLVNYHLVFGNFEYIKVCEWCKKLLIEERKGRGRFCNNNYCERIFKQASPIYKCWNRQTAWIRRVTGKVGSQVRKLGSRYDDTLTKYAPKQIYVSIDRDCQGCATCAIGEKCPTLKKKNKKILSVQEELPAIQKDFSDRRMKKKDVAAKLKGLLIGTEDTNMIAKRLGSLKIKK